MRAPIQKEATAQQSEESWFLSISASLNRRAENVRIEAVIIAELKLRNVQRQMLLADFVERADDTALEDAPKPFNRVRVNCADHVASGFVIDGLVIEARVFERVIHTRFIGRDQTDFVADHFLHEPFCISARDVIENASDDVAFALHGTDDGDFARTAATASALFLIPVTVGVFSANPCFVDFDDAPELMFGFDHRGTDFVAHIQRGFVRAETHDALHLQGADAFLAGGHHVHDAKPLAQRLVGVLEDGPGDVGEAIAAVWRAFVALPLEVHRRNLKDLSIRAARAPDAVRPTALNEVSAASFLILKAQFKFPDSHLLDGFRTPDLYLGHFGSPYRQEPIWH